MSRSSLIATVICTTTLIQVPEECLNVRGKHGNVVQSQRFVKT